MNDNEESYYRYLLTSGIGKHRAKAHMEIVAEYFWKIFRKYGCNDILDAGCGLGFFIGKAGQGVNATGIDSNKRVIEHCRQTGVNAMLGDVMNLPADYSGEFDGIMCAHILEHLPDPEKAFREFSRVLKKDGILVVRVPFFDSFFYDDWTHIRPFTKRSLNRLACATDFNVVKIYYYHYDFPLCSWKSPLGRIVSRFRHFWGIELLIDSLIKAAGFSPKELVLIAKK
jgi:SAM-dependent methyltransferase